ncbi:MAG: SH3 domain-containing protein [Myxococcales bacterium]|nr:SH3 domain-containing protein [Myxococcales bacterium]
MRWLVLAAMCSAVSCKTPAGSGASDRAAPRALIARRACPRDLAAPPILPYARPMHSVLEYWLDRMGAQADAVLLEGAELRAHNERVRALRQEGWLAGRWSLLERQVDQKAIGAHFEVNIKKLREAIGKGKRMHLDGRRPWDVAKQVEEAMRGSEPRDALRLAFRGTPIRCYPTATPLYDEPWRKSFDMMQCARLRPGEAVRVLRRSRAIAGQGEWVYIWTDYTEGWVDPAALAPAIDAKAMAAYLGAERVAVVTRDRRPLFDARGALVGAARLGARFPLLGRDGKQLRVQVPTKAGLAELRLAAGRGVREGYAALTRRAFLERAFAHLDAPYGWGGSGGHRDCSRLLMDLFDTFGLHIPRNSWMQSRAGVTSVDVAKLGDVAKAHAIEAAAKRGLVLLYMPGHIMLFVGREGDHLFALHQFSGYLVPCSPAETRAAGGRGDGKDGKAETMYRVNRTAVTSLELGRGSSRKAYIERITKLAIIGPPIAPAAASQPTSTPKR